MNYAKAKFCPIFFGLMGAPGRGTWGTCMNYAKAKFVTIVSFLLFVNFQSGFTSASMCSVYRQLCFIKYVCYSYHTVFLM